MTDTSPDPSTGDGNIAVHARIEGRVQGVWYRAWTVEEARKRDLTGWVRNRNDGSVEAVFCGPAKVVQSMITACHEGPTHARVDRIHEEPALEDGFATFEKRPTA
ncbi:acylphosphatase [Thalassospira tepidiphila]|jgi:acylphosphatase|uniref:acylphosphatase n=1 Tax=Thalassospira tepidiphila TaxID=393657 RepID=UPI00291E3E63|nr:acylphosphatase [Thalassospira tepidiphila]BDW96682.1 acylphosphatase [Thalassospira tepidiphila]